MNEHHDASTEDTRTTGSNEHEEANCESSSSKLKKLDIVKSAFTLGAPISNDKGSIEDDAIRREYKQLGIDNPDELERRKKAAIVIQKYYRGHSDRQRVKRMRLKRDARWDDLIKQTGEATYTEGQLDNKNDVKSRWRRAVHAASRLEKGEGIYNPPIHLTEEIPYNELSDKIKKQRKATFLGSLSIPISINNKKQRDENEILPFNSKSLEQQHWLEMIDGKHRYGSNMKYYFKKWKEDETTCDNFFRWLDRGEGKYLNLEEMPRERLEKERIIYLSAEKRLNYLIKVDKDGLIRWARNNELVDTAAGKWKDSGNGNGIIPENNISDDEKGQDSNTKNSYASTSTTPWKQRSSGTSSTDSLSSDNYSAESDLDDNEDTHYIGLDKEQEKGWLVRNKQKLTPGGMRKELLRKTVRRNTWIYVSDMKLNLFIGIKKSGTFQHSSFLAGGKVTSAGLIVVKHGFIQSLNPLSGHYRSSIDHFRSFIGQLEERGVDLSHVKMAKSVLLLWGLSKYSKFTKCEKSLMNHFKKVLNLSSESTEEEKSEKLKENAEIEEKEHQERIKNLYKAEKESGYIKKKEIGEDYEAEIRQLRRRVLYGKEKEYDM
uniref:IQ domain-containing calmodulin-binding protein n=1 Tax=Kwoniella pini CBS 10737 TaxID=1296096 RepID=A0A1B9I614_9TREE|nr:IQ domain-containing calmodulin-binding protein [Kwoniella pini CBS 10737]OCF50931.1 IQ domain-containing calmodulin-binding protein [Kwoniella pini CBS 10737]